MTETFLDGRRIVFFGTPQTSATILDHLCGEGFDVGLVVTRPDKRRGRGSDLVPSPVKAAAQARSIPVVVDLAEVKSLEPGQWLGVVVAYGRIIPEDVLERVPMVNVHYSLLPRWRGAAPVERAILAGDEETGVCIMDLVAELDAGAVRGCRRVRIGSLNAEQLLTELTAQGADLLAEILRAPETEPQAQTGEVTYARKIESDELSIDWNRSAVEIWRQVRALRTFTTCAGGHLDGQRVGIHAVEMIPDDDVERRHVQLSPGECDKSGLVGCKDGVVRLVTVQPQGKRPMPAQDWLRGIRSEAHISFQ